MVNVDDVQDEEKDFSVLAPEEFKPYSSEELSEELVNYAKKYLNETEEESTQKSVEEVREYIKHNLDVFTQLDDITVLCFLRARRFDIKQTCLLIRKAADFLKNYQDMVYRVNVETVRRVVASKTVGFLPYRDSKSRAILLLRAECWNPFEIKTEDILFGSIASLHIGGENPVNQVAGFVVILDCKNVSFWQVRALSSWLLIAVQALQNCCPVAVKEIHILHTPSLVLFAWKMVQSLIREDIKKRITFYSSSNWRSIHHKIPPSILPEELGGQLGPYSHEHWANDIPVIVEKFFNKCR